jgi:hypothetical protein
LKLIGNDPGGLYFFDRDIAGMAATEEKAK